MGGAIYSEGSKDIEALSDSIEVFHVNVGIWKMAEATLPRPMLGLKASNIDDSILIFGFLIY